MLSNKYSKPYLVEKLNNENFKRITLSFYRYVNISDVTLFRNNLFAELAQLQCLGRIYVANEGINAQMSIPEHFKAHFLELLNSIPQLVSMPIKWAVDDNNNSFYKLIIKVKQKIVADDLPNNLFDTTNVGKYLTATEFNKLMEHPEAIVVDMRNNYESEVGRFENAICPDAVTFREELELVTNLLENKKDKKLLLYCTGGVRCEKASAYFKYKGFNHVYQLYGGIIEYAHQVKQNNLTSKFIGKNFVFDNRMGERITPHVIAKCHQCGNSCDTHVNCANNQCHLLFIQCSNCSQKYNGCCSNNCTDALQNPSVYSLNLVKGKKWRRYNGEIIVL